MVSIDEIEQLISIKSYERKKFVGRFAKKLFIKELNDQVLSGDEQAKIRLKNLELSQEETMKAIIARHYPYLKGEERELFADYFFKLLREEVKSIYDYMRKEGYNKVNHEE